MHVPCDKTFLWVPKSLTLWPWPWCLIYLLKTLTLAISFEWFALGLWHYTWISLVTRPFHEYKFFYLLTLTLVFVCLTYLLKNNLGYMIFWMVSTMALAYHINNIPYDKTFLWVPKIWPWPWCLTYLLRTLNFALLFEYYVLGHWCFVWVFLETRPSLEYQLIWPCDHDLGFWPTYWKL
jgi:hypothetical protein